MSRILALDPGAKRIGVAVSDPLGIVARSLKVVEKTRGHGWAAEVENLVAEYQVAEVVIGLPRNMDGSEGPAAAGARRMVEILSSRLSVPVVVWDERLSTVAAQRMFRETGVKMRRAKKYLDGVAAALILQGYLDYRAKSGNRDP
jgi:putative Holliday junction resolvase